MTECWQVHTLVFDLDDTLYPERDFVLSGFAAVDRWLAETRKMSGFAAAAGQLFAAGRRGRVFDEALPLIGGEATPSLIAQIVEIYRAHNPRIAMFPDAVDILGWAAPLFRLALVTDGYAGVQARKIRALRLEPIIGCRVITDELGRQFWKPSPEPFRLVMVRCPGPAAGFLYIADNPRKDFIGARHLGWRTVRVRRTGGEHFAYEPALAEAADTEIATLSSLRQLVQPRAPA
jgi:putative hydrolase of the HAD superfamily